MHNSKSEIDSLTGLRFFASHWVFLYHLGHYFIKPLFPEIRPYYKFLFFGGGLGVDLFFILSGFVISYNYFESFSEKTASYGKFLYKRLCRIYPIHLATLVALIPVSYFMTNGDIFLFGSLEYFFKHIFLIHSLFYPVQWNTVSWSISSEWFAYCLFPVYVLLFKSGYSLKKYLLIITGFYLLSLTIFLTLALEGVPFANGSYRLIRIISCFGFGVLVFRIWKIKPELKLSNNVVKAVIPIAFVLFFLTTHQRMSFIWTIPVMVFIIYLAACQQFFNNFLTKSSVIYGGKISYSLYMIHGMLMMIFLKVIGDFTDESSINRARFLFGYVAATALFTLLAYHFIEEPGRKVLLKAAKS